jgi:hypothetical protein
MRHSDEMIFNARRVPLGVLNGRRALGDFRHPDTAKRYDGMG